MSNMMKALVYTATQQTEFRDEPTPTMLPGDALLKIEAVGICGSDMHAWHGHDPRRVPPLILGHEGCGTVLEGANAGQRVTFNPLITCGVCEYCDSGRSNLCQSRELVGMRLPGAFAEQMALPEKNLIPVPDGMPAHHAALAEPCATAWHALGLADRACWRPISESHTLVIGGGSVGLLGALILKSWGARVVRLAETNPLRLETAKKAGIDAFNPITDPASEASFDVVLDAVGSVPTRAASIHAVKPGGVISHVGLQEWAGEFDARTVTLSEITWTGVYCYTNADLRASLSALHEGLLGNLGWVENRDMADGSRAFEDLHNGATPAAKIILTP